MFKKQPRMEVVAAAEGKKSCLVVGAGASGLAVMKELTALNQVVADGSFASATAQASSVRDDFIQKMVQRTGFSEEECRCSLEQSSGNVEAAVDLLVNLDSGTV